ncbi:hypothetical protein PoB_001173800 [Plakobranchus ocellatus]|uniref:Uncharacterized protein n=1 Tax=Plakobranchus ocellatus TaxID=259542 RepID=A0AAV3YRP2_9GAST|nr:hypothetical protein PoB_001173800 [Plakobranchus ocellatus]
MIVFYQRRLVQVIVTRGMAPLCVNSRIMWPITSPRLGKLFYLGLTLMFKKLEITPYLTENWFLTPADLVGSMELRHLRSELERRGQADGLRFMDENLSQPMSLLKLSFVAVSAQLGGEAGRER